MDSSVKQVTKLCSALFQLKQQSIGNKALNKWRFSILLSRKIYYLTSLVLRQRVRSSLCLVVASWSNLTTQSRVIKEAGQKEANILMELDSVRQDAVAMAAEIASLQACNKEEKAMRTRSEQQLEESLLAGERLQSKLLKQVAVAAAAEDSVVLLQAKVEAAAIERFALEDRLLSLEKSKDEVEKELIELRSKVLGISTAI